MEECAKDVRFFVNVFGWTYDPRLVDAHLPFILYPFQDDHLIQMVRCVEDEKDMFYDKSRDMGASWLAVAFQSWGFLFKEWGILYGSYKEAYVDKKGDMDSNFERIRYFISRLPSWMKPSDIVDKHMNISSKKLGCSIAGDAGENFGTGGRRKVILGDEFSYWQFDKNAFRKTADVTNCRIFWGTPNGRFNVFGKVMTGDAQYKNLDLIKKTLHWKLHPKKTQEWYDNEKKRRTPLDMAREIDLSYDDSVEGAVYKSFNDSVNFGSYTFDQNLFLYTTWDFGRDMTAIIWKQKDFRTGAVYTIDAFQKENTDIKFFAAFITGKPTPGCSYTQAELEKIEEHAKWTHKYAEHFGDPYNGNNRNVISTNTIVKELDRYGVHVTLTRGSTVPERINMVELAMIRQFVNSDLTEYIQAMTQSRYPQSRENSQSTTERLLPVHDAYSHFRTAEEYWADNEPEHGGGMSDMDAAKKFNS